MNPTSNKSDFEDLTTNLRDLAYSYLERYSPSKQQLKVHLLKKYLTKIKGTKSKKEVSNIIDEIILGLEKNKILNDELYSDSKARMFLRRGYSLNKINQSLRNKGIETKYIKQSIDKVVCITGKLNDFKNRNLAKTYLESFGFTVTTSITKKTDYLVDEEGRKSSKSTKADSLGIPILTIKDILKENKL